MSSSCLCVTCGKNLKYSLSVDVTRDEKLFIEISVEPCVTCMEAEDDAGWNRGYAEGTAEATSEIERNIKDIAIGMYQQVERGE